ncbi:hypothetical protein B0H66DRAFT_621777 [Apodospora peruviana]|uniref:Uncharacterized protein n=1 Tax=Apodospora peruviana TaxID=516989 RepID=A0AAE0I3T4_9PEZI|nr:hypothetical protein B0H66DRAFT_621777 [Apodospora peruviana]
MKFDADNYPGIAEERDRGNAKNIPFANEDSLVRKVLEKNDGKMLHDLWALGEFEKDTESPNAKVLGLNDGRGIQILMNLCVQLSATRCLQFLIQWTRQPGIPYSFDRETLYKSARTAAVDNGNMACLIVLIETNETVGEDLPSLCGLLLVKARTGILVNQLNKLMAPYYMDNYPFLMMACEDRTSHPGVIMTLVNRIKGDSLRGVLNDPYHYGDFEPPTTPLAKAAKSLHVSAMSQLMNLGASPIAGYLEEGFASAEYNPLFLVLAHELEVAPPKAPTKGLSETAALMFVGVSVLTDFLSFDFRHSPEGQAMITYAASLYAQTLRRYLIKKIRHIVPRKAYKNILIAGSKEQQQQDGADNTKSQPVAKKDDGNDGQAGDGNNDNDNDESEEEELTWRNGVNSKKLHRVFERHDIVLEDDFMKIWESLLSPNIIELVSNAVEKRQGKKAFGSLNSEDLLYELILLPEDHIAPKFAKSKSTKKGKGKGELDA